nr:unnamed protein product [Callosobruchus chinensis]
MQSREGQVDSSVTRP